MPSGITLSIFPTDGLSDFTEVKRHFTSLLCQKLEHLAMLDGTEFGWASFLGGDHRSNSAALIFKPDQLPPAA
jgi:hypothetical protein